MSNIIKMPEMRPRYDMFGMPRFSLSGEGHEVYVYAVGNDGSLGIYKYTPEEERRPDILEFKLKSAYDTTRVVFGAFGKAKESKPLSNWIDDQIQSHVCDETITPRDHQGFMRLRLQKDARVVVHGLTYGYADPPPRRYIEITKPSLRSGRPDLSVYVSLENCEVEDSVIALVNAITLMNDRVDVSYFTVEDPTRILVDGDAYDAFTDNESVPFWKARMMGESTDRMVDAAAERFGLDRKHQNLCYKFIMSYYTDLDPKKDRPGWANDSTNAIMTSMR